MSKKPTKQDAEQFMYNALVLNRISFGYEWQGWRMAGRDLVSPDGDRISAGELRWMLGVAAQKRKLWKQVEHVCQDNVVPFTPRRGAAR